MPPTIMPPTTPTAPTIMPPTTMAPTTMPPTIMPLTTMAPTAPTIMPPTTPTAPTIMPPTTLSVPSNSTFAYFIQISLRLSYEYALTSSQISGQISILKQSFQEWSQVNIEDITVNLFSDQRKRHLLISTYRADVEISGLDYISASTLVKNGEVALDSVTNAINATVVMLKSPSISVSNRTFSPSLSPTSASPFTSSPNAFFQSGFQQQLIQWPIIFFGMILFIIG